MSALAGAPFPLQPDAFSCRDAPDFNRAIMQIASNHALFENSVNAQSKFAPHIRCVFAVVKLGSCPYCGRALRDQSRQLGNSKLQESNLTIFGPPTRIAVAVAVKDFRFLTQFELREAIGSQSRLSQRTVPQC
jgi:hypothetical protein